MARRVTLDQLAVLDATIVRVDGHGAKRRAPSATRLSGREDKRAPPNVIVIM
jgi:hypothetical protein